MLNRTNSMLMYRKYAISSEKKGEAKAHLVSSMNAMGKSIKIIRCRELPLESAQEDLIKFEILFEMIGVVDDKEPKF